MKWGGQEVALILYGVEMRWRGGGGCIDNVQGDEKRGWGAGGRIDIIWDGDEMVGVRWCALIMYGGR